ncbi:ATP-binding cassette domain-containing protein [Corynebacterium sanguinis]|uniref:Sugar ABC transporter ATP-binding protein n=1 Tax=Corynebacterium sanguinis TaxID=2594913 RepID=A0A838WTF6_9CORY|nr:ATP-binding cassette domain-containing protein [Corynebacterium sanguinis]MBA4505612.1 sugar ABC transporter ATP-binding protein [Corynebacterium sanguinis]MCT1413511.1 ATP-binding cassette domain-containing protein [Corynebacterium sanguinis]MCT1554437.1 ATP-binding cassette domain-containing protein [Corynebacterium sanguinis]MCT1584125.1 ATP-binding cassette domain-containing protein [Corynebacterium sanguinis]MCT1612862.1 ATP-binding cassette domain-containing protein [Corynebacterium s
MAIIQLEDVTKSYGAFDALRGVNLEIDQGEVLCVLGDNGAGKSTLIKILSGLHQPTSGQMLLDGTPTTFSSPRDAINHGIATVYQNLAIVDSLSVWRNFFLGNEISGMLGTLKQDEMRARCDDALRELGINIPDVDVEAGNLSGGQRQVLAIARAIHFGARVVILDEPTAALGVKQSGVVLRFVAAARDRGVAVVLVTHNPHHAYLVGDRFTILKLGRQELNAERADITLEELTAQMAGGEELAALSHELER